MSADKLKLNSYDIRFTLEGLQELSDNSLYNQQRVVP
jgi:hypothetical protein